MVKISCMTCDMEVEPTGMDEIAAALNHTHDIDGLRTNYGDEIAEIYVERMASERWWREEGARL